MTKEEIISSGKLELYVTGSLSDTEIREVEDAIREHSDLVNEIEVIEKTYIELAENVSPILRSEIWNRILERISGVRKLEPPKGQSRSWTTYTGWAAAVLCMGGIFWMMKENNDLKENLRVTNTENVILKEQVENSETRLTENTEILDAIRSDEFSPVILAGNVSVAPEAFVKIYYNEKDQVAYIDAQGLPTPPEGKVYQVWSLLMDPLTPTDAGLLTAFTESDNKIFKVDGLPNTEGFGITLEPEGGSESPTLSQLYVLGTVSP